MLIASCTGCCLPHLINIWWHEHQIFTFLIGASQIKTFISAFITFYWLACFWLTYYFCVVLNFAALAFAQCPKHIATVLITYMSHKYKASYIAFLWWSFASRAYHLCNLIVHDTLFLLFIIILKCAKIESKIKIMHFFEFEFIENIFIFYYSFFLYF